MRRMGVLIVSIMLISGGLSGYAVAKTDYKAFAPPDLGKSVLLKSGVKHYRYFELESGKTVSLEISGPAKIKIRTRALFSGGSSSGQYSVAVWEGEKVRAGRKTSVKTSKLSLQDGAGKIGLARDVFLRVPKGKHKYSITFGSDNIDKLYLRFYQEKKKKKKAEYVSFRPYEFARRERVKSGKSEISYYFIDDNGGANLKVIGPTKIKVYCRANFDPTQKEKSKFSFGAFEKGKEVKKFSAIAKKSLKSVYTKVPELIPSTVHTFTLDVPDGEHLYEFRKINSLSPNLAVRFRILKSSLGKKR